MTIDIHTFVLILGLSHLVQFIVFAYQMKVQRTYSGLGWWLGWCVAEMIGFTCVFLRGYPVFLPVIIMLQNIAIISGVIFIYIGICRFIGIREDLRILIPLSLLFVLGLLYFLLIHDKIHYRSAIIAATFAIFSFLTARVLLRSQIRSIKATAQFNAVIFILHGLYMTYRFFYILIATPDLNVFTVSLFQVSIYVDGFIVGLLWTYGFIIMMNQRLTAEMTESKEHFESIFNTSPDASLITRMTDGVIYDINNSLTRLTGYTREESIGNSSINFLWKNPDDRRRIVQEMKDKGFSDNFEATFLRKDGTELTGLMSARIITLEGKPFIISVTRDITARKQAEDNLKESEAKLKELNATKDKFFSIIAHDLLNPFNNILGFMDVIISDFEDLDREDLLKYLKIVDTSSQQAYNLLDNLLLWARSHTGSIDFRPETTDLENRIRNAFDLLKITAEKKEVTLSTRILGPLFVKADRNMLDTILRNLLTNALKFSFRKGKILISAQQAGSFIEVSVADNGLGITQEDLANIFRMDSKTSTLGTEKEKGSGLGLILCREFVEKNGGRIWAESEYGRGSVFRFTLPAVQ